MIGQGAFGTVLLVQKKDGGDLYAMKQKIHTRTERRVLGTINHPFIVKLYYAFQTRKKLFLILDYAAGGELFFHLIRLKRFPELATCFYCAEITLALDALHKLNILLDRDGHVKLADFGLAKENVTNASSGAHSLCGTIQYVSPEGHGTAVDWWNLGMVTYEMLTGLPPWYSTNTQQMLHDIMTAPLHTLHFPPFISTDAASFIFVSRKMYVALLRWFAGTTATASVVIHQ
ncbi:pkbA, partial [Symbiodinium microadriaticum]